MKIFMFPSLVGIEHRANCDQIALNFLMHDNLCISNKSHYFHVESILKAMPETKKKPLVFVSYSHEDADKMKEFAKYLRVFELTDQAELWTDRKLVAGTEWDPAIKAALEASSIILILISINSIVSKYIRHIEMKRAYEKYIEGSARVICVILEDCPWLDVPTGTQKADGSSYLLKHFQAIKPNSKAIYDPAQPSLAIAMDAAYKQIAASMQDFLSKKS